MLSAASTTTDVSLDRPFADPGQYDYDDARSLSGGLRRLDLSSSRGYDGGLDPAHASNVAARAVLAAKAGGRVPWMVGKLPADEEEAVLATLKHIDAATKPAGPLAKKWGSQFKN